MSDYISGLARLNVRDEKIVYQYGHTPPTINPNHNVELHPFISHELLMKYMRSARVIICHGGPATIFQALSFGKIPFVLPRKKRFGEHVNNHQIDFCNFMAERSLVKIITTEKQLPDIYRGTRAVPPLHRKNQQLIHFLDMLTIEVARRK
jgi:UDP-N-acetylglucosamine transferase subunit ALG13